MKRQEAIKKLVQFELERLSLNERVEQLEIMTLENWSDDPQWGTLPNDIQQEFEEQELREDASSTRYDPVLSIWLADRLGSVTNQYLIEKLGETGEHIDKIVGSPLVLEPCPCCGYRTIGERGCYEICKVCWWEDDGQDNNTADIVMGGPNYHLSLTQARINFLTHGISDPTREDLVKLKHSANMYEKGRVFEFLPERSVVTEPETGWVSNTE